MLRPFDYDIMAWKLVNYPHLISEKEEVIIEKLGKKIRESEMTLDECKQNEFRQNYSSKTKQIARLENKTELLKKARGEKIKATEPEFKNQRIEQSSKK